MRNLKLFMIGTAVAAVAALAAPVASATTLNLPTGRTISAEAEGTLTMDPVIGTIGCTGSKISGKTSNAGSSTETVNVAIETFTETGCNAEVVVLQPGSLIVHTKEVSANNNGTLTWTGTELTTTFSGFHCIFGTNDTDVGTLTGSATTGGNATLDIAATIPRTGGRSGAFCGSTAQWTGSFKFTKPSQLNVDGVSKDEGEDAVAKLSGGPTTGNVGETATVTWENTGEAAAEIDDETVSDKTVVETTGAACGTIAATSSCTSRKIKCLKAGEATITARDTPSVEGHFTIKCDAVLTGEPTTANVGETVTVTWKNSSESALVMDDEGISNGTVVETLGSSCGTIAATSSCTSRKIKCLKAGESTITAADTPSVEGKFVIKCD